MAPRVNHTKNMMIEHLHGMGFNREVVSFLSGASKSQVNYVVNPDSKKKKMEYNRRFIKENPDLNASNNSRYRINNPSKFNANSSRINQIRKSKIENSKFENLKISKIYEAARRLSKMTGKLYHVHHEIPLSKGGEHKADNLWILNAVEHQARHAG